MKCYRKSAFSCSKKIGLITRVLIAYLVGGLETPYCRPIVGKKSQDRKKYLAQ